MNLPPPKVCRRIVGLHARIGSSNTKEAEIARDKLLRLLTEHGLNWNDVPAILAAVNTANTGNATAASTSAGPNEPEVNVFDLVVRLIEKHVAVTVEERTAVALWCLHAYVFDRFSITPRLALLSPVRGCGKTTLFIVLESLIANAFRSDNITPAALYHILENNPSATVLADEGDNLGLLQNNVLRAVFNAGHRRGGAIHRYVRGWPRRFGVFAPLAVAAIGTLPLPLTEQCIIVNMQRSADENQIELLDETSPIWTASRDQIRKWAATCSLASDPEMPRALRGRAADNFRPLFAVADSLGKGDEARAAAVALCAGRSDEDPAVMLLTHLRHIFDTLPPSRWGPDRAHGAYLVDALVGLEDGPWAEWRGIRDNRPPRKLNQSDLAQLLRPFGIQPMQRRPGDRSARAYLRSQFEAVWDAYCPRADTASQPSRIIHLPRA
jgi:hypothetical protein